MNQFTGSILAIVAIFLLVNAVFWFRRYRRYIKPVKKAEPEEQAMIRRQNEIQRRFNREHEEALKRIELRNSTLALYEQVRKNAAARERQEALDAAKAASAGTPSAAVKEAEPDNESAPEPEAEPEPYNEETPESENETTDVV